MISALRPTHTIAPVLGTKALSGPQTSETIIYIEISLDRK